MVYFRHAGYASRRCRRKSGVTHPVCCCQRTADFRPACAVRASGQATTLLQWTAPKPGGFIRVVDQKGFEPLTPGLQSRCSTTELLARPIRRPAAPLLAAEVVRRGGLEPPTSRLSGVCSNQLSYRRPSVDPLPARARAQGGATPLLARV